MSEVDKVIQQCQSLKKDPFFELEKLDNICQSLLKAGNTDSPDSFDFSTEDKTWRKIFDVVFSYDISKRAALLAEELGQFLYGDPDPDHSCKQQTVIFINDLHEVIRKVRP